MLGNVRLFSRGQVIWEAISGLVARKRGTPRKPANTLWVVHPPTGRYGDCPWASQSSHPSELAGVDLVHGGGGVVVVVVLVVGVVVGGGGGCGAVYGS